MPFNAETVMQPRRRSSLSVSDKGEPDSDVLASHGPPLPMRIPVAGCRAYYRGFHHPSKEPLRTPGRGRSGSSLPNVVVVKVKRVKHSSITPRMFDLSSTRLAGRSRWAHKRQAYLDTGYRLTIHIFEFS